MLSVPKMNFEIVDRRGGPGRVQLARAVVASDAWEVLIFQLVPRLGARVCDREHRFGIHSGVAHNTFEGIVGIRAL